MQVVVDVIPRYALDDSRDMMTAINRVGMVTVDSRKPPFLVWPVVVACENASPNRQSTFLNECRVGVDYPKMLANAPRIQCVNPFSKKTLHALSERLPLRSPTAFNQFANRLDSHVPGRAHRVAKINESTPIPATVAVSEDYLQRPSPTVLPIER